MTTSPRGTLSLSTSALPEIARRGVSVPAYDRSALRPGIVHFGVGGFHRAHMAMALDDLHAQGEAEDWGIIGAGLLAGDTRMRDALAAQDHLYTLTLKHPDGTRERRVIGSIIGFLHGPDDPEALLSRMSDPATRIVSLTVTEGGYNVDPVTGRFVTEDPQVQEDLRALRAGEPPATVFGYVIEALRRRWDAGGDSFTVQSCDNIPGNGDVARRMFSAFAESLDPALAQRIRRQVRFPNAMVDRITPVTTDADREELREGPGIEDAWPVVAEPFFQWVIEDDFGQGRPPYEDAGAQMVPDVTPYEHMKIRLLNASHQGLAYFGTLAGHTFAHEAMADPAFGRYLRRYMDEEATPSLEPVPGVDLEAYKDTLLERFANPEIRDTLARLGAESSDRIPKWLVPVILEDLDAGVPVPVSAAICASWARYAEGTGENGEAIGVVDRFAEDIRDVASRQAEDPLAFVRQDRFFGDLADREEFTGGYLAALGALHRYGAAEVVRRLADHEAL